MANDFHIAAGLIPDDNGATGGANYMYISAGLIPDDLAVAGGGTMGGYIHTLYDFIPIQDT